MIAPAGTDCGGHRSGELSLLISELARVGPVRHIVHELRGPFDRGGHDVHLALGGEVVCKDTIDTSRFTHASGKIKDRGPARFHGRPSQIGSRVI